MDVGRVQSSLAAVCAGPARLGADEPHTGAGGVEVDLVLGRVELVDIGITDGRRTEIITDKLKEGDEIIIRQIVEAKP